MRFLAHYWWLLVLPLAVLFWIQSMRQISAIHWVWILRLVGVMLLVVPGIWLLTGDVQNQYVSIHMGSGSSAAVGPMLLGVVALAVAHRLPTRRPPA